MISFLEKDLQEGALKATSTTADPLAEMRQHAEVSGAVEAAKPYSTRTWGEIRTIELPPQEYFWSDAFAMGQTQAIIGQGGLGKTRFSLNLVRNQVLGIEFAGMNTGGRPLVHLMMGSENSIHRLQWDIQRMSEGLTGNEHNLLSSHVHLATLEDPSDGYITVTPENCCRWDATIKQTNPDVLWVDPFADVLDGDPNSDQDTRRTLATLTRLIRQVNTRAGVVILHHSRTGAANIAQATGFDAANFGKGSKGLYSSCRAVVNLAPYDASENPEIVCVCAKNNNARRFEPFALSLNEDTMTYSHRPIDIEKWRKTVLASTNRGKATTPRASPDEMVPQIVELVREKGVMEYNVLIERAKAHCNAGRDKIRSVVNLALEQGVLITDRSKPPCTMYGTPEQIHEQITTPTSSMR